MKNFCKLNVIDNSSYALDLFKLTTVKIYSMKT